MHARVSRFLRELWTLARPYWYSEEKTSARLLLAAIIALTLGMVYMNVQISYWNNAFFTVLQKQDAPKFFPLIGRFTVLASIFITMSVYQFYLRQALQIRWRRWLTRRYTDEWLADNTYYRLQVTGNQTDNPDQRIAEDLGLFVDKTLSFTLGLIESVVTLLSFVGILWGLSGTIEINWRGDTWEIYGYMVWVALAYAVAGTWISHRIGKRLIPLNFDKQKFEANFRFGLARFRENTEAVALSRGEEEEKRGFLIRFASVAENWWAIMKRQKVLNAFTTGYAQAAIIFPYIVAAPRYFARKIELGDLTQTAQVFGYVQSSLSWFIDVYPEFAAWKATVERLTTFHNAIQFAQSEARSNPGVTLETTGGETLSIDGIDLALPGGQMLLAGASATIAPRERVLLRGPSGSGKSTLFRVIAGIWPFGRGRIRTPRDFDALFLPQRPYFPMGTLREAVAYPAAPDAFTDERLCSVLAEVGLAHLAERLDRTELWSQQLSGGEQQRIAFARALLQEPRWLFLDEATSSLDAAAEAALYTLLNERLAGTTIVSIAHRPEIARYHQRVLEIDPQRQALAG